MKNFYRILTCGIIALTIYAAILPTPNNLIPGGGAFLCFIVVLSVYLFELLYKAVAKK